MTNTTNGQTYSGMLEGSPDSQGPKFGIQDIHYYLSLVIRRRWFLIIPFCIAMVVGIYLALTLTRIYEASTLILVEPQRVPSNFVQSIVSSDLSSRINSISQQILSRTNLEKIIQKFDLFSKPEHQKLFMEDKIEGMRKRINIQVTRGRRELDTFAISFRGPDPRMTMQIANELATYFIDQNLKVREAYATGTKVFLDQELVAMRARLEQVEEKLKNYQVKYMGEMPEQLQSNLMVLGRMQEQLIERQKALRETREGLLLLEKEAANQPDFQIPNFFEIPADDGLGSGMDETSDISRLKEVLFMMKGKYTDKHPDVVNLADRIAYLEKKMEEESETDAEEAPTEPLEAESAVPEIGFQDLQEVQRLEIKKDIINQKADLAHLIEQIKMYQRRIENTPKREQELISLRRDYNNLKDSYDSLEKRKLEADMAVNMEKRQKGEQFRILDTARLPEKPVSPNMQLLFIACLAVGLGIGAGFIFLLDILNDNVKKIEDITDKLRIPMLAAIPSVEHPKDRIWRRINATLSAGGVFVSLALLGCLVAITVMGMTQPMELIEKYIKL